MKGGLIIVSLSVLVGSILIIGFVSAGFFGNNNNNKITGKVVSSDSTFTLTDEFDFWEDRSTHGYEVTGTTSKGVYQCASEGYCTRLNCGDETLRLGYGKNGGGKVSVDLEVTPWTDEIVLVLNSAWCNQNSGNVFDLTIDGVSFSDSINWNELNLCGSPCQEKEIPLSGLSDYTQDGKINIEISDAHPEGWEGDSQLTYLKVYSKEVSVPTPSSIPTCEDNVPACNPKGYQETSDCNVLQGWTCDPSKYDEALQVHFYDTTSDPLEFIGATTANIIRPDVTTTGVCGGFGVHGFIFETPDSIKDGNTHTIQAYGINIGGGEGKVALTNGPKVISGCCLEGENYDASTSSCVSEETTTTDTTTTTTDTVTDTSDTTTPATPSTNPNLILHWKFNEGSGSTAIDASNNNNDGEIKGAIFVDGKLGKALSLSGNVNSYVIKNSVNNFPTDKITTAFWIKTSDSRDAIISYTSSGNGNDWLLFSSNGITIFRGRTYKLTGLSINDNNWHYITSSWDSSNGETKLYIDGILKYNGTQGIGTSITPEGSFIVGQNQNKIGGEFNSLWSHEGIIDDVRVYSKVLNAEEIREIMGDIPPTSVTTTSTDTATVIDTTPADTTLAAGNITEWFAKRTFSFEVWTGSEPDCNDVTFSYGSNSISPKQSTTREADALDITSFGTNYRTYCQQEIAGESLYYLHKNAVWTGQPEVYSETIVCTDTDGGLNYSVKGHVEDIRGFTATDVCNTVDNPNELIEFKCEDDGRVSGSYPYLCPEGCFDGACVRGEIIAPIDEPIDIPEDEEGTGISCSGCILDDKCYPFGFRKSGEFCSDDNSKFITQLDEEATCENNFECDSNVCISGKCISGSLFQRILDFFRALFGAD